MREQSSIGPSSFYGLPPRFKPPPTISPPDPAPRAPDVSDVVVPPAGDERTMDIVGSASSGLGKARPTESSSPKTKDDDKPIDNGSPAQNQPMELTQPSSSKPKKRKHRTTKDHHGKDADHDHPTRATGQDTISLQRSPSQKKNKRKHRRVIAGQASHDSSSKGNQQPMASTKRLEFSKPSSPSPSPKRKGSHQIVSSSQSMHAVEGSLAIDSVKALGNVALPSGQGLSIKLGKKKKRHQSLPATFVISPGVESSEIIEQSTKSISGNRALQELSPNMKLSKSAVKQIEEVVKAQLQEHRQNIIAPADQAEASALAPTLTAPESPTSRARRKLAARKLKYPPHSANVPEQDRKSDGELIEIGKEIKPYSRHCAAPYAFSWRGSLLARYKYLLGLQKDDGSPAWTAEEQYRINH